MKLEWRFESRLFVSLVLRISFICFTGLNISCSSALKTYSNRGNQGTAKIQATALYAKTGDRVAFSDMMSPQRCMVFVAVDGEERSPTGQVYKDLDVGDQTVEVVAGPHKIGIIGYTGYFEGDSTGISKMKVFKRVKSWHSELAINATAGETYTVYLSKDSPGGDAFFYRCWY